MKINTLNDLRKLIKLCRENGVHSIKIDGMELGILEAPAASKGIRTAIKAPELFTAGGITEDTKIETDVLTEDQLLFYSSASHEQEHMS